VTITILALDKKKCKRSVDGWVSTVKSHRGDNSQKKKSAIPRVDDARTLSTCSSAPPAYVKLAAPELCLGHMVQVLRCMVLDLGADVNQVNLGLFYCKVKFYPNRVSE
jgi:hypothetical protein